MLSEVDTLEALFNVMGLFTVLCEHTNECLKLFYPRTPCNLEIWIAFHGQREW